MAADFIDDEFVTEDENNFDVVIIGAGLAGLTCAYNILKRKTGLDVLIVEANNEIGGRVLPKDCSDYFHVNSKQKHIVDLMKLLHIRIVQSESSEGRKRLLYTKRGPSEKLPKFYGAEVHNFLQTIEENALDPRFKTYNEHEDAKELAETSVEQLLRRIILFPYARSLCRAFISSTCARRNLKNVSALWFIVMLNGASGLLNRLKIAIGDDNRYFIQGGTIKIAQELLKKIRIEHGKIKYLQSVSEIKFNDDRAYVITEKAHFKCEFVVVAVPPPMHDRITISTPAEYSSNPRAEYASGENIFFNVTYRAPPWSDNYTGDILTTWDHSSNLNIAYHASHEDNEGLVLAGFLAELNSLQTQKKDLFGTLKECFGTIEATEYLRFREHDRCSSNIETEDSSPMSVMKPTSIANYIEYMGVPAGRIFFASSEYAADWPGTLDGAIEAGETTAYAILSRIRPQALTYYELNSILSKSRRRRQGTPFKIWAMQYLGLLLNIAVFLSFLRTAYNIT